MFVELRALWGMFGASLPTIHAPAGIAQLVVRDAAPPLIECCRAPAELALAGVPVSCLDLRCLGVGAARGKATIESTEQK